MKNKETMITSLLIASLYLLLSTSCQQSTKDVTSEIAAVNEEFMTKYYEGDFEALSAYYTQDVKLYPPNSDIIETPEGVAGFYNVAKDMGIQKVNFITLNAERIGNTAIEEGLFESYAEGDYLVDQGRYIVTWKKEDGKWKIHRDIWNSTTPIAQSMNNLE